MGNHRAVRLVILSHKSQVNENCKQCQSKWYGIPLFAYYRGFHTVCVINFKFPCFALEKWEWVTFACAVGLIQYTVVIAQGTAFHLHLDLSVGVTRNWQSLQNHPDTSRLQKPAAEVIHDYRLAAGTAEGNRLSGRLDLDHKMTTDSSCMHCIYVSKACTSALTV